MKKALILSLAAILMVASGVAAVSAYEAHIINVTAHVENALYVDDAAVDFGVMFPQEWNKIKREVRLSDSAGEELGTATGDLDEVSFKVFARWKVDPDSGTEGNHLPDVLIPPVTGDDYYAWIGEWLWVAQDATQSETNPMLVPAEWTNVGVAPDYTTTPPTMHKEVTALAMTLDASGSHFLDILFLAPCFEGYYNEDTDVKPAWWPTMWTEPGPWPLILDTDARHLEDGVDLGLDLKIQVTEILRVPPPAP